MEKTKQYKKFLILENDIESQGLPNWITNITDEYPDVEKDIWWWFSQSIIQEPKESFKRFSEVADDTFILTAPSFIGYDNTFDGYIYFFKELKNAGIKLKICVVYYPDFYWYLIDWLTDTGSAIDGQRKKDKKIKIFKEVIEYHEIYSVGFDTLFDCDYKVFNCMKLVTWDWLSENYYRKKDIVMVKATGEKIKIDYAFGGRGDKDRAKIIAYGNQRKEFKFTEIEKIKK